MPKIIENLKSQLLQEAKKQIETGGYSALTIRSVAKNCGVGVGTVYNYFPSKDDLIATYLLEDWSVCIAAIQTASQESDTPGPVIRCMYDQLISYARRHQAIFRDKALAAAVAGSFSRYHTMLRSQLAAPIRKFCSSDFAASFIAESLLSWSMSGRSFDEIYGMIGKLF